MAVHHSSGEILATDLRAFYDFIGEKLQSGNAQLRPDEVWDEWLLLHFEDEEDDSEAIQKALDEMDAGDTGTPWEVVEADLRKKHNLPPRS